MTHPLKNIEPAELEAKVRAALGTVLERPIEEPADKDLGLDSLDRIETSMKLESEFGFEDWSITDGMTEGKNTVADWCEVVAGLLAGPKVEAGY
jgi:acyl carrier protein